MTKIKIGGIEAEMVSEAEAETADMVVCVPWEWGSPFSDDICGYCVTCGRSIRYRPHAPKRPPKICLKCAAEAIKGPPPPRPMSSPASRGIPAARAFGRPRSSA